MKNEAYCDRWSTSDLKSATKSTTATCWWRWERISPSVACWARGI